MHMRNRTDVKDLRKRRTEERLDAIARGADRRRKLSPGAKLDIASDLVRDAWSLHDAAKETLPRRRR